MSRIDWNRPKHDRASVSRYESASPRSTSYDGRGQGGGVRRFTPAEIEAFAAARGVGVSRPAESPPRDRFTAPVAPLVPQASRGRGRLGMKAAAAVVALRQALRARQPLPRCWELRNIAAEALTAGGRASVPPDVWRDGWAMVYDVPNPKRREPWTPSAC